MMKYDLKAIAEGDVHAIYADEDQRTSVYISRPYASDATWEFSINHYSGSTSRHNEEAIEHTAKLIGNLQDCMACITELMSKQDELNALRAEYKAELARVWEAERAAAAAKVMADKQLTPNEIGHMLAIMVVDIKHSNAYHVRRTLRLRGSEKTVVLAATRTGRNSVQFKLNGDVVSQRNLAPRLQSYAEVVTV
jgi:hypothetical protein